MLLGVAPRVCGCCLAAHLHCVVEGVPGPHVRTARGAAVSLAWSTRVGRCARSAAPMKALSLVAG